MISSISRLRRGISRAPLEDRAFELMRRSILIRLEADGPQILGHIPATWPLTRHQVRAVVDRLVREGLVETSGPGNAYWMLSLTDSGRAAARSTSTAAAE